MLGTRVPKDSSCGLYLFNYYCPYSRNFLRDDVHFVRHLEPTVRAAVRIVTSSSAEEG